MADQVVPAYIPNWIQGKETPAANGLWLDKFNPHNGKVLCLIARSARADVEEAVSAAKTAQLSWAAVPPVGRGMLLLKIVRELEKNQEEMARIVSEETGKSYKDAYGETGGAIQCGLYFASEGQRLHGYTTTSGAVNKFAYTIRQPIGVAGLISAANTPIANIAWKVFPALICGNSVVFKSSEDSPATSWFFGKLAHAAGVPAGLINVIQGLGDEAGSPIVEHPDVKVISFTGSTAVGRYIQETAGKRLIKISLELGGKNALVVCDDADLERAVTWSLLSAFSNAGQRCAAGSRIVVFDSVYETFKKELVSRAENLKVGMGDSDDFGPVINQEQLNFILTTIRQAEKNGARLLTGGIRLEDKAHAGGYYLAPTILESISPDDDLSNIELFGPVTCLYRVKDFEEALAVVNSSAYGLTASIHTTNTHRMMEFVNRVETGVAVVNAGTYGSEPHMPFGGLKESGNGTREPGREAVDIYSNWKTIYIIHDPKSI